MPSLGKRPRMALSLADDRDGPVGNPRDLLALPSLDLTDEAYLELELHLLAKMRVRYPDIPEELARQFARRLDAGALKPAAWDGAVAWLEATDWFSGRRVPATDARVA